MHLLDISFYSNRKIKIFRYNIFVFTQSKKSALKRFFTVYDVAPCEVPHFITRVLTSFKEFLE